MSLLVAFVNVPLGSILCINGQIKVSIQQNDFIGFDFTNTNTNTNTNTTTNSTNSIQPSLVSSSSSLTTIDCKNKNNTYNKYKFDTTVLDNNKNNNYNKDDNNNIKIDDCDDLEKYYFITVQCNNCNNSNNNNKNTNNSTTSTAITAITAITTGYFIPRVRKNHNNNITQNTAINSCFILQYNPQTEEVISYNNVYSNSINCSSTSSTTTSQQQQQQQEQQTTINNLLLFYNNKIARQQYPYRIINYNQLLLLHRQSQSQTQSQSSSSIESQSQSSVESQLSSSTRNIYDTCYYISKQLLYHRGTILPGTKIIPSMYDNNDNTTSRYDISDDKEIIINPQQLSINSSSNQQTSILDGICVQYPSIPLVMTVKKNRKQQHPKLERNKDISNERKTKLILHHSGTKGFLKQLSTIERTNLFCNSDNNNNNNNVVSTKLLPKVLQLYYSTSSQLNFDTSSNHKISTTSRKNSSSHQGADTVGTNITSSTTLSLPNTTGSKNTNSIDYSLVLGDIQLSFLLFTTMNCYTSYIHWKDLLHLLCISFSEIVIPTRISVSFVKKNVQEEQYEQESNNIILDFYGNFLYIFANQLLTLYPSSNAKNITKTTNGGILESIVDDDVFTSSYYNYDNDCDNNDNNNIDIDNDNDMCLNKNFVLSAIDTILVSLQDYFLIQQSQQPQSQQQDQKLHKSYQLFVNTVQHCFQQYYIHRWENKNQQQQIDDDSDTIYDTVNDRASDVDSDNDNDADLDYTMKDTSTTGVTMPIEDMSSLSPRASSSPMLVETDLKQVLPQLRVNSDTDDDTDNTDYRNNDCKGTMYDTDKYDDDDDDDEDGPIIVDYDEIQASVERSQQQQQQERTKFSNSSKMISANGNSTSTVPLLQQQQYQHQLQPEKDQDQEQEEIQEQKNFLQTHYPLLYGSMISTNGIEDIVMTCSRVLYDKNDVSLVREAAHYLQTIEDKR